LPYSLDFNSDLFSLFIIKLIMLKFLISKVIYSNKFNFNLCIHELWILLIYKESNSVLRNIHFNYDGNILFFILKIYYINSYLWVLLLRQQLQSVESLATSVCAPFNPRLPAVKLPHWLSIKTSLLLEESLSLALIDDEKCDVWKFGSPQS
jgi:hypothetical protein